MKAVRWRMLIVSECCGTTGVNFDEQAQKEVAVWMKDFFLAYVQVAEEWAIKAAKEVYSWIVAPWSAKKFIYSMSSL